jgi:hypothetical protein
MLAMDLERYQKRLDKKLGSFSGQFMNDTKWTKLFKALANQSSQIKRCLIKDVLDSQLREIKIPNINFYSNTFYDKGIKDVMSIGPLAFREIECLVFPKVWTIDRTMRTQKLEPHKFEQDIAAIKDILNRIGQFEIKYNNDALIIFAYK